MSVIKILLLAVGVWLIYSLLKNYVRSVDKDEEPVMPPSVGEDMVRCAQCAVHLPRSEAVMSRGEFFCCEEHRRLRHPD